MGEERRFRRAHVEDYGEIAALCSISSHGVADYIWRKLAGRAKIRWRSGNAATPAKIPCSATRTAWSPNTTAR